MNARVKELIENSKLNLPKNFTLAEYLNYGTRSVMPIKDRDKIALEFFDLILYNQQKCLTTLFSLQAFREKFGNPIFITCGYRSKRHELSRGRSGISEHLRGALDVTTNDMRSLNDLLKDWDGGYKWYESNYFIHVDSGRKRRW